MRPTDMLGGAYVRRPFDGGKYQPPMTLTTEQLLAIPMTNRRVLIEQGFIEPWPAPPQGGPQEVSGGLPEGTMRHVVSRGSKFDVIEGVKLNPKPLTREEAAALSAAFNSGKKVN